MTAADLPFGSCLEIELISEVFRLRSEVCVSTNTRASVAGSVPPLPARFPQRFRPPFVGCRGPAPGNAHFGGCATSGILPLHLPKP
jgi:hypothetical protein